MPLLPKTKIFLNQLKLHPNVETIKIIGHKSVRIKFNDGLIERWSFANCKGNIWVSNIDQDDLFNNNIKIATEYETDLSNKAESEIMSRHFYIGNKQYKNAGKASILIKLHELIKRLLDEGWMHLYYPQSTISNDLNSIFVDSDLSVYGYVTGLRSLLHYNTKLAYSTGSNISLYNAWKSPGLLYYHLKKLVIKNKDISRFNLVRSMMINGTQFYNTKLAIVPPSMYYRIFKHLNLESPVVIDLKPNYGECAVAVKAMDGVYYSSCNNAFDPIDFGFELDNDAAGDVGFINGLSISDTVTNNEILKLKARTDNVICCTTAERSKTLMKPLDIINTRYYNIATPHKILIY